MKFTKPLDNILNTEAKTKILRFLCRTQAQWNGRQIAREIGVTPAAAHTALRTLYKEGVLTLRNMGKTHVYSMRQDSFLTDNLLKPLFAKEDKILDTIISMIRRKILYSKIKKDVISVALFGSVNVHNEQSTSDIDILVIVKNISIKRTVECVFEEIDDKVSKEFGNTVSLYIHTRPEFKAKYKKGVIIIKNILKTHNLIYGERIESLL